MSRSRVLQFCMSDAWGGLEMVALETALKLRANGYASVTVCLPGSPLQRQLQTAGLFTLGLRPGHKYFSPRLLALVRRLVQSDGIGAILIQQMADLWHVVPALSGFEDIPLVAISHTFVGINKTDLLHEILYGRVDRLIALTEPHRRNLAAHLPLDPRLIEVLPNAVDTAKFNPARRSPKLRQQLQSSESQVLIGIVSRLDRAKGLLDAVTAAGRLKELNLPFKMVIVGKETAGEPGTKAALENEIIRRGLDEQVQLMGHRDDIETAVASFDVLLMPSPNETFGRVVIEAMACAVPVVASAGGGVPGIIQSGSNGLLFPPGDSEKMAEALQTVCRDPGLRLRLAAAGLRHVNELYDSELVTGKLHRLLGLPPRPTR